MRIKNVVMKRTRLGIILLFASFAVFCQNNILDTAFYKRQVVFSDDFVDNRKGWFLDEAKY